MAMLKLKRYFSLVIFVVAFSNISYATSEESDKIDLSLAAKIEFLLGSLNNANATLRTQLIEYKEASKDLARDLELLKKALQTNHSEDITRAEEAVAITSDTYVVAKKDLSDSKASLARFVQRFKKLSAKLSLKSDLRRLNEGHLDLVSNRTLELVDRALAQGKQLDYTFDARTSYLLSPEMKSMLEQSSVYALEAFFKENEDTRLRFKKVFSRCIKEPVWDENSCVMTPITPRYTIAGFPFAIPYEATDSANMSAYLTQSVHSAIRVIPKGINGLRKIYTAGYWTPNSDYEKAEYAVNSTTALADSMIKYAAHTGRTTDGNELSDCQKATLAACFGATLRTRFIQPPVVSFVLGGPGALVGGVEHSLHKPIGLCYDAVKITTHLLKTLGVKYVVNNDYLHAYINVNVELPKRGKKEWWSIDATDGWFNRNGKCKFFKVLDQDSPNSSPIEPLRDY